MHRCIPLPPVLRTALAPSQYASSASTAAAGVLGVRGAGKTALLRILGGLEAMESGVIRMGGAEAAPEMRARAAAVMGADVLLFEASVRFNVALGFRVTDHALASALDASGLLLHDWAREHIEGHDGDWTSLLDVHAASSGAAVRQCLGLARTILLRRPMVLLDEPTSCQPPHVARHQAKALRNGACRWQPPDSASDTLPATVVISTRSPMVVAEMDLAFVLSHGLLVEHGPPRKLLKRSSHLAQVRFVFNPSRGWRRVGLENGFGRTTGLARFG
jgi:ABC-type multidrug transport system fused ATPase/permease subunit